MRLKACLLALVCASGGCAFFHNERSDARAPSEDAGPDRAGAADGGAAGNAAPLHRADLPSEPADLAPEVWIGQLWSTTPMLCGAGGLPPEEMVIVPEGIRERVVLVIESKHGQLTGRIQLGELDARRTLPKTPPDYAVRAGTGDSDPFWECSILVPAAGIEYTMFDLTRTPDLLTFNLAGNEYWNSWCRATSFECPKDSTAACSHDPVCSCDAGTCQADLRYRIQVQLAFTKDTLEGRFVPAVNGSSELRLRRVK